MLLLEFACRGYRFAVPLASVRRVVSSAQPVPLPGAPGIVLGMLNIGGEIVVIVNFYQRVGLSFSAIGLSQQLLIIEIAGVGVGLLVDQVSGVMTRELPDNPVIPHQIAGADFARTIIQLEDGLCLICDPEKFLLDDEKIMIDWALEKQHEAAL